MTPDDRTQLLRDVAEHVMGWRWEQYSDKAERRELTLYQLEPNAIGKRWLSCMQAGELEEWYQVADLTRPIFDVRYPDWLGRDWEQVLGRVREQMFSVRQRFTAALQREVSRR